MWQSSCRGRDAKRRPCSGSQPISANQRRRAHHPLVCSAPQTRCSLPLRSSCRGAARCRRRGHRHAGRKQSRKSSTSPRSASLRTPPMPSSSPAQTSSDSPEIDRASHGPRPPRLPAEQSSTHTLRRSLPCVRRHPAVAVPPAAVPSWVRVTGRTDVERFRVRLPVRRPDASTSRAAPTATATSDQRRPSPWRGPWLGRCCEPGFFISGTPLRSTALIMPRYGCIDKSARGLHCTACRQLPQKTWVASQMIPACRIGVCSIRSTGHRP